MFIPIRLQAQIFASLSLQPKYTRSSIYFRSSCLVHFRFIIQIDCASPTNNPYTSKYSYIQHPSIHPPSSHLHVFLIPSLSPSIISPNFYPSLQCVIPRRLPPTQYNPFQQWAQLGHFSRLLAQLIRSDIRSSGRQREKRASWDHRRRRVEVRVL